ncbi:50S ribosomal protein L32 [Candidatus Calescamantes bacterium]|nr:50S ribosomal protein L32 [bacterium]MCK5224258.1 50S ribosomal protein L32 [Candidatus Calescamantes bacterium]MCK5398378.1 50S ribosomal protein L32 [bacterium]MCK5598814.1 50S ribosomal protein L32 [bacterium]
MALPKVKKSRSRTRHRRSHAMKFKNPAITVCSHCGQPKRPHAVCSHCGYYNDRQVLTIEE